MNENQNNKKEIAIIVGLLVLFMVFDAGFGMLFLIFASYWLKAKKNFDATIERRHIPTSNQFYDISQNTGKIKNTTESRILKQNTVFSNHPGYVKTSKLKTREDFYENAKGFTPEEIIELNDAMHNEFSHDIYHESNKTVHYSNGLYLVHNATTKEYYYGKSFDTIKTVCQKLKKGNTPLRRAFFKGESLRIKILTADGNIFINNYELEIDLKSRYKAKQI